MNARSLKTTAFLASLALLTATHPLDAATWDGGGGNNLWETAANWNPDGVPGSSGSTDTAPTISGAYNVSLTSNVTLGSAFASLNVSSGATLNIGSGAVLGNIAGLNIDPLTSGGGTVVFNGGSWTQNATNGGAIIIGRIGGANTGKTAKFQLVSGTVSNARTGSQGRIDIGHSGNVGTAVLEVTGGTLSIASSSGLVFNGATTANSHLLISGGSVSTPTTNMAVGPASGLDSLIRVTGDAATTISLGTTSLFKHASNLLGSSTAEFVFDNTGISKITSTTLNLGTGADKGLLDVDVSLRLNDGTMGYTLFDYTTLTNGLFGSVSVNYGATALSAGTLGSLALNEYALTYGDNSSDSIRLYYNVTNSVYWTGNTSASWGVADNWSIDQAGMIPRTAAPSALNDLHFTANTASNLTTTLGANFTVNSVTIANPGVSIGAGHTLTAAEVAADAFDISANSGTTTLAVNLAGANAGLTKSGNSSLILSGTNTYAGGTTLTAGTLVIANAAGAGNGTITQADGTSLLKFDTTGTVANNMSVYNVASNQTVTLSGNTTTNNAVYDVATGTTLTVSGKIGGSGSVTMNGSGTLALAAANDFGGALLVNTGTVVLTGANAYSGGTTVSGGTLQIGAGGATGSATGTLTTQGSGVLEFNRSNATTVSGTLAGNGTFRQIGGNTITLDGTNTTSGTIAVTSGTILFSGANALPANGSLSAATNGTLSVADGTTQSSTLAGGLTMTDAIFVFDINSTAGDYLAFTGAASLSGTNVVKLNLSNATSSTWTLMTAASGLDGGTWSLDTGSFNPSSFAWTLTSNATTLTLSSSAASNLYYWTGDTNASWGTASNWSSDSAGTSPRGSAPSAANDLFFTADTASNLSTTLGADFAVNTISITHPGVSIAAGNTLTANATSALAFNISANSGTTTLAANLAGANAGLTKSGDGSLTLSGSNTYGGATTISGGHVTISGGSAIADTGAVVLSNAAGVQFTISTSETIGSLKGGGASGGNVTIASGQTLTVAETGTNTFSGILGGAGSLVKSGAGTMVLDGANTYTGATTISAGTLQIGIGGATGSIASTSGITNNGVLVFNRNGSTLVSNTISGNGAIILETGTLQIGNGGTTGSIATTGAITNNGSLEFNRSDAVTVSQAISGSGGINQLGSGAIVLTAGSDYTGATTISAGTLQIGNGGTTGSIASTSGITNNGLLVFNRSDNLTISQAISGTGGLAKLGSGTTVLSGDSDYSGATTISAGTLQIGNGGTTGSIASTSGITNNGSLVINRSDALTISQVISGTGELNQNGSGTTVLTANSTYAGATTITAGTLQIGNGGTTGSIDSTSGITNNGVLAFNRSDNLTISQAISGTGGLTKLGGGTLVLSGNNSYTGTRTLAAGTLQLDHANAIGTAGNISFTGGTLVYTANNTADISSRIVSSNAAIRIDTNGQNATYATALAASNSGGLVKNGSGTLVLAGNNSYTGGTTINAGTLQIGNGGATGSLGNYSMTNNGTFVFNTSTTLNVGNLVVSGSGDFVKLGSGIIQIGSGASSSNWTGDFVIANATNNVQFAGGSFLTRNNTLDFQANGLASLRASTTIAGLSGSTGQVRTEIAGVVITIDTSVNGNASFGGNLILYLSRPDLTLSVNKTGIGTQTLYGTNVNTGNLSITGGTLQIGNGGTTGSFTAINAITNNSNLTINRSNDFNQSTDLNGKVIAGTGSVTQAGSGALILSSANTYSGGTTLNTGTLVIANATGAGNGTITQADASSLLKFDTTGTVANNLSVYNVSSNKTLTLSGNITAQNTTYDVASGTTLSLNGTVGGSGGVTKNGTGTLELNGSNNYSGATVVNTGTLKANAAGSLGNTTTVQVNSGSLLVAAANAVNNNANITLNGGTLAVSGNFNQNVGALTLSADSVIDLNGFSGILRFSGLSWASTSLNATLAIWNWSGTTHWGTEVNNWQNPSQVVFADNTNLTAENLAKISFYSGSGGNSFVGDGFSQGFSQAGFEGSQIIAVPEPETVITAAILLLGFGIYQFRLARQGQGLFSSFTLLRSGSHRKPSEGQPPA